VYDRSSTLALPEAIVRNMMEDLGTDRVELVQTVTETTLVARETDKGMGLSALLDLAGQQHLAPSVVGDSAADLAMFRVAGRSYAPGHIRCRSAAEVLGCRIAKRGYQPGLLESVRLIVHPDGKLRQTCRSVASRSKLNGDLFAQLLTTADKPAWFKLLSSTLSPSAVKAFPSEG